MKKITGIFISFLLVFLFVFLSSSPIVYAAWESWTINRNNTDNSIIDFICPVKNLVNTDAILDYIRAAVSEKMPHFGTVQPTSRLRFQYAKNKYSYQKMQNFAFHDLKERIMYLYGNDGHNMINAKVMTMTSLSWQNHEIVIDVSITSDRRLINELNRITAQIRTAAVTPRQQLWYINQYLADNVEYHLPSLGQGTYDALVNKKSVCAGYSGTVLNLCYLLNIPALNILSSTHSWNSVFVEGKWRMWDPTWDKGTGEYFLVDEIIYPPDRDAHNYKKNILNSSIRFITSKTFSGTEVRRANSLTYTGRLLTHKNLRIRDGGRTLVRNRDYTLRYSKNRNAGTGQINIRGKGTYRGMKVISFTIKRKQLPKPTRLKFSKKRASWRNVRENRGYRLIIRQGKKTVKTVNIPQNRNFYNIPNNLLKKGVRYNFTLITKGRGNYRNSKAAVSRTIRI
ncbi:MAG: hypothetical protein FWG69_03840 [Oscillospiraceae bacterium]|nr:hypothetical protein [Oscillospiraceae bacterium]